MPENIIQIYFGDGKGKTTAALGQALRCCGRGNKVLFVPFLKNNDSGEFLTSLPFDVEFSGYNFGFWNVLNDTEKEVARKNAEDKLTDIFLKSHSYNMIVLDELLDAIDIGCLKISNVLDMLTSLRNNVNLVITGHKYIPEIFDMADCITQMKKIKHHYDNGICAQPGIEK